MSIDIEMAATMSTRPCSFCLCLQGGSVFADFDRDDSDVVWLRRISFDGYGCFDVAKSVPAMTTGDSRLLLDAIAQGQLEGPQVEEALRRYFRQNRHLIWNYALAEHDLL